MNYSESGKREWGGKNVDIIDVINLIEKAASINYFYE